VLRPLTYMIIKQEGNGIEFSNITAELNARVKPVYCKTMLQHLRIELIYVKLYYNIKLT
jgi:hypothetical protein